MGISTDGADQKPEVIMDPSPSWYPAISPDGKLVAAAQPGKLFLIEMQTRKIVATVPLGESRGVLAAWSPDGKWVAYGGFDDDPMGIWIFDVQGKKAGMVMKGPFTMPAWSANGEKLAFDVRTDESRQVWIVGRAWVEKRLAEGGRPAAPAKPSGKL
jgi:Tol biopolymer transport system component